jgi:hypothetical protein
MIAVFVHDLCREKTSAFPLLGTAITHRQIFIFPVGDGFATFFLYISIDDTELMVVDGDVHP